MARTRTWATEEGSYTDATLATSIDNTGTDLRVDVREVVNQLMGVSESTALADPVVPVGSATLAQVYELRATQTYKLCVPWQSFHWAYEFLNANAAVTQRLFLSGGTQDSNLRIGTDPGYLQVLDPTGLGASQSIKVAGSYGLMLPVGVTITALSAEFYRNASGEQVTVALSSHSATTAGGSTTIATATSTGSTTGSLQSVAIASGLPATLATDIFYRIDLSITGSANNTQQRLYGVRVTYTSPNANVRV